MFAPKISIGFGDGTKGPVVNPLVLYSVTGTNRLIGAGAVGAYCKNSMLEGDRMIAVTFAESAILPAVDVRLAVLVITVPCGGAALEAMLANIAINNRIQIKLIRVFGRRDASPAILFTPVIGAKALRAMDGK